MPVEAKAWFDRASEIDSDHPASRSAPLYLNYYTRTKQAENARLARELLDDKIETRLGSRFFALQVMFEHSLRSDSLGDFLGVLDNLYPHLFDDPPHDLDRSPMALLFTGRALYHNGDTDRGIEFLQFWKERQEAFEGDFGVTRTIVGINMMLGDRDAALHSLERFGEDKYYVSINSLVLEYDPLYDPIREEPAFEALMDEYRSNAGEQRQLLQAMNED